MPMMYADSSDAYAATLIGADAAEDFFGSTKREIRELTRRDRRKSRRKSSPVGCADCPEMGDYIQVGATLPGSRYTYGGESAWGMSPSQELPASVWNQQLYGMLGQDLEPAALYEKNRERLSRFPARVAAIRSTSAQRDLSRELAPLLALRDELAPAFASGAKPGARDIDKLKLLNSGVDAFGRRLRAAEKAYGVGAAPPAPESVPMAAPKAADPIPPAPAAPAADDGMGAAIPLILAGVAALLLLK
jgi:hypothetical protein